MTYRSDVDALAARKAALDAEVAARTRERDEAARMLVELQERAKLPVLPNIRIASPCTADWNAMTGDERVRHCAQCDKDVFNLSAMTRVEAEALIVEKNHDLCARYYQRKDGTILLSDCEVGRAQQRRLKLVGAGLLVTITAGAAAGTMLTKTPERGDPLGAVELAEPTEPPMAIAGGIGPVPSTGIDECDRYRDALYDFASCENMPSEGRKALLDAYAQAESAWAQVPEEGRAALANACKAATQAIRDSIQKVCNDTPPIETTPVETVPPQIVR